MSVKALKIKSYKEGDTFETKFGTKGIVVGVDEKNNVLIRWDGVKKLAVNTKSDMAKALERGTIVYVGFNPHFGMF